MREPRRFSLTTSRGLATLIALTAIGLALSAGVSRAGESLRVLPDATTSHSLPELLEQQCREALARRRAAYEEIKTEEDVHRWQQQRRDFFRAQLGAWPEPSPLNAQVVGTLQGDGYRVEKIILESQPQHHITANLYLPETAAPYPVVLVPCGHSYNGKAAEGYQRVSILLARNGIAAFCYDPIGQGERYQTFDTEGKPLTAEYNVNPNSIRQLDEIPGHPRFNPVEEHTLVGVGAILVGRNTATYRIYDGMRCIDYLVSRPDIDPERIGCTGNSGGGTLTAYLMALDDRIACAAPGCYMTTFERQLASNGPQDAEQNIFGQIAFGMDHPDYVLMRAPRPTCLLTATRDVTFDIVGSWDNFRESKRVYARLGFPERIDLVEADAPHGFTTQLRVGAVRFMRRWFMGVDDAVTEGDFPIWDAAELQCTPTGQVMQLAGERSVMQLNHEEHQRLAAERAARDAAVPSEEFRRRVGEALQIQPDRLPRLEAEVVGKQAREGYTIEQRLLHAENRCPLPALAFVPAQPSGQSYLYLHGNGKQADADAGEALEQLVRAGHFVLAVDLSGIGETEDRRPENARNHWSHALFGADGESFWLAYLLGRSLVGLRTEDTLMAARYLHDQQGNPGTPAPVHVIGIRRGGLPALHAAALAPDLFASVTLRETLSSWSAVVATPLAHEYLVETVHGVLRTYDLPDLVALIGPDKVTQIDPRTPPVTSSAQP